MTQNGSSDDGSALRGVLFGCLAYAWWGLSPLFWKALDHLPVAETLAFRVIATVVLLAFVVGLRGDLPVLFATLRQPRRAAALVLTAVLILTNWGVFVWAVSSARVTEASLGYFINPLMNVLLGVVVLRETLRRAQWLAVALAAAGVLWLTVLVGTFPWVSLLLAGSFAAYGLLRKTMAVGPLVGLSVEMVVLMVPAVLFLWWIPPAAVSVVAAGGWPTLALLLCSGAMTAIPLLCFAAAARAIPLSLLGVIQYVAPTLQFLLGVFYYDEPFGAEQAAGYGLVWIGLAVFLADGLWSRRAALRKRIG